MISISITLAIAMNILVGFIAIGALYFVFRFIGKQVLKLKFIDFLRPNTTFESPTMTGFVSTMLFLLVAGMSYCVGMFITGMIL